jgi:hypothetical protein
LVIGYLFALAPSSDASPAPWTWVMVTASKVIAGGQQTTVTATCPAADVPITGGWEYDNDGKGFWFDEIYSSRGYSDTFYNGSDGTIATVSAWCAPTASVTLTASNYEFTTNQDEGTGFYAGAKDMACAAGMTPVSASTTFPQGAFYLEQSGPESVGGVHEWRVVGLAGPNDPVDVSLRCISDSDLTDFNFVTDAHTNHTGDPATLSGNADCAAGQRLVGGGVHIDSVLADETSSEPASFVGWSASAEQMPDGDTLTVYAMCIDSGNPVATITGGPQYTDLPQPTFFFTASDPAGGTAHNWCFVDTVYYGDCAGGFTVPAPLSEGQHVFSVEAYTDDNRGGAPTEQDRYFYVDLTAPTATLAKVPRFVLGKHLTLQASGHDNYGIDHYSISVASQSATGAGAATRASDTSSGTLSVPLTAGTSYVAEASATDLADNVSHPSADIGFASPMDNFALKATKQWTLVKGAAYTNHLVSRTTSKGATLTKKVDGNWLGLVVTTCPTCGKVGVYSGKHLIGKVSLRSAKTTHQTVIGLRRVSGNPEKFTAKIKVLSHGKRVEIDGLGVLAL